jgi:hypothetical protein
MIKMTGQKIVLAKQVDATAPSCLNFSLVMYHFHATFKPLNVVYVWLQNLAAPCIFYDATGYQPRGSEFSIDTLFG